MLIDRMHKEDVKAVIRKRYRTIGAFERAENLTKNSVAEVLRGRASRRTELAIERVLREQMKRGESIDPADSAESPTSHRLNAQVA